MSSYVQGSLWYYAPNKILPIIFAILFLLSGLLHTYQTLHYKTWRTTILLPWSALIMVAGFSLREAGAYNLSNLNLIIASNVLVMSGPPVYAAVNYLILSRVLYYVPYLSPLHPGRVLTTFLALDGMVEALIATGAVRIFNSDMSPAQRELGARLVKSALIIQAGMFAAFVALALWFHLRASRAGVLKPNTRTVLLTLYFSSALVFARCVYRAVEFFQGYGGALFTHEAYFWVFEAALMWANTALLNVWHVGRFLPRSNKVFLARDGVTERSGPGWHDRRHWVVTVVDPFDLWGLVTGKDKKTEFWNWEPEELERVLEREREEKKRRKERGCRPWWCVMLDPLHLYGSRGLFARGWRKMRGTGAAGAGTVDQTAAHTSPPPPSSPREKRSKDRVVEQMV